MKTPAIILAVLSTSLAACGGGGSNGVLGGLGGTTGGGEIVPDIVDVTEGNSSQLGELVELLGPINIEYGFAASAAVFSADLRFSLADIALGVETPILVVRDAQTSVRLSPDAEPVLGDEVQFSCSYASETDIFACVLDAEGPGETLLNFSRVVDGVATGTFSVCLEVTINECVANLLISPNGDATMTVGGLAGVETAGRSDLSEGGFAQGDDLMPYVEYFMQGTVGVVGGESLVDGENEELVRLVGEQVGVVY